MRVYRPDEFFIKRTFYITPTVKDDVYRVVERPIYSCKDAFYFITISERNIREANNKGMKREKRNVSSD